MYRRILKFALPIPKLEDYERYLFIGPHPDDIEVGCGGFVHKLKRLGKEIVFVIVTDGGSGSVAGDVDWEKLVEVRKDEAKTSAELLGAKRVFFLDLPDGGDYRIWDLAKALAPILVECESQVVFAPDPHLPSEIHPDHLRAGSAAGIAVLMSQYPLMYERNLGSLPEYGANGPVMKTLAYYYTHRPNRKPRLSSDDIIKQKLAIRAHKSQFDIVGDISMLERYLKLRGRMLGAFGKGGREGYFVLGPTHQHSYPEVNDY
ncbi:MAG: PIG-L family deacetylase [Bacilli bacterium]|nr:PIG-L family deacetylase [Bacilli bacterium]MBN2696499.1 PIG-L family deacetylase [Bacilli bacterium]